MRKAGRTYAELKKMGSWFQDEVRSVLDEPMREMRETADLLRDSTDFTDGGQSRRSRAVRPAPVTAGGDGPGAEPADGRRRR